jgi:hypothetical protein
MYINYAYATLSLLRLFDPSLEIRYGVMGLELIGVMPAVQGCCSVQCWKLVVSYHTKI